MATASFSIRGKDAYRNANKEIVVPYPDLKLKSEPIILTTPCLFNPAETVMEGAPIAPTVTSASKTCATIADQNSSEFYYLNILIIDIDQLNSEGSKWGIADSKLKTDSSKPLNFDVLQVEGDGSLESRSVNFLTPYWKDSGQWVSHPETANPYEGGGGVDFTVVPTTSKNAGSTYYVNRLGVVKGWSENPFQSQQGRLNFYDTQARSVGKPAPHPALVMNWEKEFLMVPVVFVTPQWKVHPERPVEHYETVVRVDRNQCTIFSNNSGPNYSVGILAMPHSRPRMLGSFYETAFGSFSEHFAKNQPQLNKYKDPLTQVLLHGDADGALASVPFEYRPVLAKPTGKKLSALESAMLKVTVDFVQIVLTALEVTGFEKAKPILEKEIEVFVTSTKAFQEMADICLSIKQSSSSDYRTIANAVVRAAKYLLENGIIHMVLTALGQSQSWVEWAKDGLTILAQIAVMTAAIVGTDGAALELVMMAWIARIMQVLDGLEEGIDLFSDCEALVTAWTNFQQSGGK